MDHWRWAGGLRFLNYTTKMGKDDIIIMFPSTTRAVDKSQDFLPNNWFFLNNSPRPRFYTIYHDLPVTLVIGLGSMRSNKVVAFMWSICHKQLQSISGEPTSLRLSFPSNVLFASLILVNQLSISFGTASKPGEHGNGLLLSCMSSTG